MRNSVQNSVPIRPSVIRDYLSLLEEFEAKMPSCQNWSAVKRKVQSGKLDEYRDELEKKFECDIDDVPSEEKEGAKKRFDEELEKALAPLKRIVEKLTDRDTLKRLAILVEHVKLNSARILSFSNPYPAIRIKNLFDKRQRESMRLLLERAEAMWRAGKQAEPEARCKGGILYDTRNIAQALQITVNQLKRIRLKLSDEKGKSPTFKRGNSRHNLNLALRIVESDFYPPPRDRNIIDKSEVRRVIEEHLDWVEDNLKRLQEKAGRRDIRPHKSYE